MTNAEVEPLTDHDAIIEALADVETGDNLTIEDESGYRDERDVFLADDDEFTFGDPDHSNARIINTERGTVHRFPQRPDDSLGSGYKITRLWVWE